MARTWRKKLPDRETVERLDRKLAGISCGSREDEPGCRFQDLSEPEQRELLNWVEWNLEPRREINQHHSSYGLKHMAEYDLESGYITNLQFKVAMELCGYHGEDGALNPHYAISQRAVNRIANRHERSKSFKTMPKPLKDAL